MVREIAEKAHGAAVLGVEAICAQNPHASPASKRKRSPAPRFHAVDPRVRKALEIAYRAFRDAHQEASEALRAGKKAVFPPGSFAAGRFIPLRI